MTSSASPVALARVGPHHHAVNLYDDDGDLVSVLVDLVLAGLSSGRPTILVVTPEHREAVETALVRCGVALDEVRRAGNYVSVDAADLLSRFMDEARPDAARFDLVIGPLLDASARDDRPVQVFGEMVGLLWQEGNVAGAIELEGLWNELGRRRTFTLLCAYRMSDLREHPDLAGVDGICRQHSSLTPPRGYTSPSQSAPNDLGTARSEVFLCVPAALPAVRHWLRQALLAWGVPGLVDDALVVATELATNAIRHAGSAFRASAQLVDGVVRLSVEDLARESPRMVTADTHSTGGRGVALVSRLSQRWGCDSHVHGKVIWAELSVSDPAVRPDLSRRPAPASS